MDILRKDLKRHETVKKIYAEWADSAGKIETENERFKYLLSEISVSYNLDLSDFEKHIQNKPELDWESFKYSMLIFIHNAKPMNLEKTVSRAANEIENLAANDLISAAIEYILIENMKKKLFSIKSDSWISPYMKTYAKEVMTILDSLDTDKTGEISADQLVPLLESLLTTFSFDITEKDVFLFKRMIENRYKVLKSEPSQQKYLKISFFNSIQLIEEWAVKESFKQISVKDQVKKTVAEYITLYNTLEKGSKTSAKIRDLIRSLKAIRDESLEKKQEKKAQQIEELQVKGLKEIFDFYAKQIKMVGQHPSFSEINNHQTVLNLSKFTKFCSDFGLLSSFKDKYKLQLSILPNIFLKATKCKREMTFADFLSSFDFLADHYYNDQYDFHFNERLSSLKVEEKRKRLLLLLKCDDPKTYSIKLKGFGQAFSLEKKGFRLPENDIAKKYKFKDQTIIKQKIENWKNSKKEITQQPSRSNSVPSHARLKAIQQSLLARPDRVTWDLLNKNLNLITKDELSNLLEAEDIKELAKVGVKL